MPERLVNGIDTVKLPGRNQPEANIAQLVHDWLSNEWNGKWIMILDGADDSDVFYGPGRDGALNGQPLGLGEMI